MTCIRPIKTLICLSLVLCLGCTSKTEDPASKNESPDVVDAAPELEAESSETEEEQFAQARDFFQRGDYNQAYDLLWGISDTASTEYSQLRAEIELCKTLKALGKSEEATHKRNTCLSRLRDLNDGAAPEVQYVILMAEAYAGLPDLDGAIQILNNAKSKYPDEENQRRLGENSSRIYYEAADSIEAIEIEKDFKNKLDYLCLSLSYDETNKQSQFLLLNDFIFPHLNEDQQNWIADAAVGGKYPAGVRVTIGVRGAIRKDINTADKNFRTASQANQDIGLMIDGLLDYSIKSRKVPDERMIDLVEKAIEICPDVPQLKRTRGTLNMFMKNFEDAASDFQSYLDESTDEFCIWSRRMMAEAHRKLGNADAAELAEMRIEKAMKDLSLEQKEIAEGILSEVNREVRKQFN